MAGNGNDYRKKRRYTSRTNDDEFNFDMGEVEQIERSAGLSGRAFGDDAGRLANRSASTRTRGTSTRRANPEHDAVDPDRSDRLSEEDEIGSYSGFGSRKRLGSRTGGGRGYSGGNGGGDGGRRNCGNGRNGRRKKKHRARRTILTILIILLVLAAGAYIGLRIWFSKGYQGEADVLYNDIDPDYDVWDGYLSILILGTDGTGNSDHGADVDILMSINKTSGEIRMLSFYRDLYLVEESGSAGKLTDIYRHGGSVSAINALNINCDLCINEYVTMGWDDVSEAIDLLGGVEVNVPEEMIEEVNDYIDHTANAVGEKTEHITSSGPQTLTGVQAVAYCRIRYINVTGYSMGDFGRSERQREVLTALIQKAKSSSVFKMLNVVRTVWPDVQTSLSLNEALMLMPVLKIMRLEDTAGFPRSDSEIDHRRTGTVSGVSIVYSSDTLSDISWIYEYLFDLSGYEPTEQAKQYAALVESKVG